MHLFFVYSLGLGRWEMFELSRNAVEYIFADNGVKNDLRKYFNSVSKNMEVWVKFHVREYFYLVHMTYMSVRYCNNKQIIIPLIILNLYFTAKHASFGVYNMCNVDIQCHDYVSK